MTERNNLSRLAASRGFTILELLAVIAIIAILGTIVTINLVGAQDKARKTKTLADMKVLSGALDLYRGSYGFYPATGQLQVLVAENLMKSIPNDAWGRPLDYYSPAQFQGATMEYLIVSAGPNMENPADDLVRLPTDD